MSQGDPELRGPWNQGDRWDFQTLGPNDGPVGGGDGLARVTLGDGEAPVVQQRAMRTQSRRDVTRIFVASEV